ncbi:hypothetical protein [Loktanella sp. R86503]|uniref:hypothetical protein n=1 Tax=Loktanella sp. R86503 TaxID=3093847 RepID=UPI0036D7B8E1
MTVARFWSKVDVSKSDDQCWNWKASANRNGYGRMKVKGQSMTASRIAWEIDRNMYLGDRFACHHCDNKLCCNPTHIYAGSASDNMRDMAERGLRDATKLTPDMVRDIRKRHDWGERNADIAAYYGVDRALVSKVITGRSWAWVAPTPSACVQGGAL